MDLYYMKNGQAKNKTIIEEKERKKKEKEKEVRVPSANRLQKMYFFGPNHRGYERD